MKIRQRGFTLIEIVLVLAAVGIVSTLIVPSATNLVSETRLRLSATQMAGILRTARSLAIRYSAYVAVRFTGREPGAVSYSLYRDGNGNGVLSHDIATGVDPVLATPHRVDQLGVHFHFGFPPGPPIPDPTSPDRLLRQGDDPIRFGASDLASFDALGGATPGSIYLTDGKSRLAAVRVTGRTGRVRVMIYEPRTRVWH